MVRLQLPAFSTSPKVIGIGVVVASLIWIERDFRSIAGRTEIAGHVTARAASEFGLACRDSRDCGIRRWLSGEHRFGMRGAVESCGHVGNLRVVRQTLGRPVLDLDAGTFCYKAGDEDAYVLGCAGSNGGNVLDWGRQVLGQCKRNNRLRWSSDFHSTLARRAIAGMGPSAAWSWHGLTARTQPRVSRRSILEGVIFNLAHYVEIVQKTSREQVTDLVLSGNGFLHPSAAPILATLRAPRHGYQKLRTGISARGGNALCAHWACRCAIARGSGFVSAGPECCRALQRIPANRESQL